MTSVASFKDRLSRIANEVHAAADLPLPPSPAADPGSARRRRSTSSSSPVANGTGTDTGSPDEIAKYKADIQKLKESEAEIKALSFNYAAILKDKEEQLSKLREENSSLRTNLDATSVAGHDISYDNHKQLSDSSNMLKLGSSNMTPLQGTADQLPIRPRHINQFNTRNTGNYAIKGNASRQDNFSNGSAQAIQLDAIQRKVELKSANSLGNGKERTNMLEESHKSLLAVQANLESEIKQLKLQLDNERECAASIKLQLQEEQRLNEHSQKDLQNLKKDNESMSVEIQDLYKKLSEKISELGRQQVESKTKNLEEMDNSLKDMNDRISILENENDKLKIEKDELEASLKVFLKDTPRKLDVDDLSYPNRKSSELNEATEKMAQSIIQLEDSLRETCKERDKALQELARLKQHLLEKELADEDKMDEDSKTIDELKVNSDYQRAQILQLEKALRQEVAKKEEFVKLKSDEVRRLNEIIVGLNQKVTDCMRTVDSKNVELLNLQTALGQYYAEIDAKEHLGRDLYVAREESTKLSESLRVSKEMLETVKREKDEIATKLSQAERNLLECKFSIQKLEDDNSKLRSALEQSMTTLNRMSLDSDNYVDRRIVIKLLVTYFQRNHSKEVLDLMVRMLGFPEEDEQRIGAAQQAAGKGVVRGVLGLPGRLVGGIIGGNSPEVASHRSSDSQSFADLWVDFLLKENEERERRESSEAAARMSSRAQDRSTDTRASSAYDRTSLPSNAGPSAALPMNQTSRHLPKQNLLFEHSDSEFATVPLTSSGSLVDSSSSRPPPRY